MFAAFKSWFRGNAFEGQGVVFKLLRFLNLVEDKAVKLSLSGLQMWAATMSAIWEQWQHADHVSQAISAGTAMGAAGFHAVKRAQTITDPNNPQNTPDEGLPPWTGEDDDK